MKVIGYGKAKEEDIVAYEQKTGCRLPNDYRQFLLEYNGGEPEIKENHLIFPEIKSSTMKVCYFSWITKTKEVIKHYEQNLLEEVESLGMFIDPKCVIPFVGVYGSIPMVMITKEGMEGIYLFDFQLALKESSRKKYLHKVCDTFTEFLELIVPNEQ